MHIVAAENRCFAAVILRDGDDHIVGTDIVLERRRFGPGDRQRLAQLFTGREAARRPHQNQFIWQIWTGHRWQMLDIVDPPRGDAARHATPDAHQAPTSDHPLDADGTAQNGEQR